ncbi:MAG: hypothetical protein GY839_12815 [candidate division Zixibacteria bacterium]|nr:hypothetical protein [candidate division Zixibacteria bacterium]
MAFGVSSIVANNSEDLELMPINGTIKSMVFCLKRVIATIIVLAFLVAPSFGSSNKFFGDFSLGPNCVDFGSRLKSILPTDLNEGTCGLLSLWGSFGYKYKNAYVMTRFGMAGSSRDRDADEPHYSYANIYMLSLMASPHIFQAKRLSFRGTGGFNYTYFLTAPTNNASPSFKYHDTNISAGLTTSFRFRYSDVNAKKVDRIIGEISYEQGMKKHRFSRLRFTFRRSTKKDAYLAFNVFIVKHEGIFDVYAFTIGGYGFWGFWQN